MPHMYTSMCMCAKISVPIQAHTKHTSTHTAYKHIQSIQAHTKHTSTYKAYKHIRKHAQSGRQHVLLCTKLTRGPVITHVLTRVLYACVCMHACINTKYTCAGICFHVLYGALSMRTYTRAPVLYFTSPAWLQGRALGACMIAGPRVRRVHDCRAAR